MMAVAQTLLETSDTSRTLHLFDTFTGMTAPSDVDLSWRESTAAATVLRESPDVGDSLIIGLDEVRANPPGTQRPIFTMFRAGSKTPFLPLHPSRLPSCAWTPIGTNPQRMNCDI